jgi:hypothetical protein
MIICALNKRHELVRGRRMVKQALPLSATTGFLVFVAVIAVLQIPADSCRCFVTIHASE